MGAEDGAPAHPHARSDDGPRGDPRSVLDENGSRDNGKTRIVDVMAAADQPGIARNDDAIPQPHLIHVVAVDPGCEDRVLAHRQVGRVPDARRAANIRSAPDAGAEQPQDGCAPGAPAVGRPARQHPPAYTEGKAQQAMPKRKARGAGQCIRPPCAHRVDATWSGRDIVRRAPMAAASPAASAPSTSIAAVVGVTAGSIVSVATATSPAIR